MLLNKDILSLDIKVQSRYRKWFSTLGMKDTLAASSVILGDSDIDYSLGDNIQETRILNAPYSGGIKHKLIYNGVGKDFSGEIKCFHRKILANGDVQSLYDYNLNENWTTGVFPPTLANGKNIDIITFDDTKMGYILFFETVLDFYLTEDNIKKRFIESYNCNIDWNGGVKPATFDFIFDSDNGSILISKNDTSLTPVGLNYRGTITMTGGFSNKVKIIKFNF